MCFQLKFIFLMTSVLLMLVGFDGRVQAQYYGDYGYDNYNRQRFFTRSGFRYSNVGIGFPGMRRNYGSFRGYNQFGGYSTSGGRYGGGGGW